MVARAWFTARARVRHLIIHGVETLSLSKELTAGGWIPRRLFLTLIFTRKVPVSIRVGSGVCVDITGVSVAIESNSIIHR